MLDCECWRVRIAPEQAGILLTELRQDFPKIIMQIISSKVRPNPRMIGMIAAQTARTLESGASLVAKPELDLLLRIAGTTQVSKAVASIGYKSKGNRTFIALGDTYDIVRLSDRLRVDSRFEALSLRSLTEKDRKSIEAAALLSTKN